jgi:hypothetical protein
MDPFGLTGIKFFGGEMFPKEIEYRYIFLVSMTYGSSGIQGMSIFSSGIQGIGPYNLELVLFLLITSSVLK